MRKRIAILGSTGSIGRQTLEVAAEMADSVEVAAISALNNIELLTEQARQTGAKYVCIGEGYNDIGSIKSQLPTGVKLFSGTEGLCEIAALPDIDLVVFAIFGSAGLRPLVSAITAGHDVAFASKEALVAGGSLVMNLVREKGISLLPIDSEHNSVFRCLYGRTPDEVRSVILTATGGPFKGMSRERLESVTLEDTLNHPVWSMGKRITVNSATMFNKALEIIEAHHLFGLDENAISVLIHPQAVVHGFIELADGTLLAHLSQPDMKYPIRHCLSFPDEPVSPFSIDPAKLALLEFQQPDETVFTPLQLGRRAVAEDWTFAVALNAVNEVLVDSFLCGEIQLLAVMDGLRHAAERFHIYKGRPHTIEDIIALDAEARVNAPVAQAQRGN